jgi:hypothetical protein
VNLLDLVVFFQGDFELSEKKLSLTMLLFAQNRRFGSLKISISKA